MWIVKGAFLGVWLFGFGTMAFLYFAIYRNLPPHSAVAVTVVHWLHVTKSIVVGGSRSLSCSRAGNCPLLVGSARFMDRAAGDRAYSCCVAHTISRSRLQTEAPHSGSLMNKRFAANVGLHLTGGLTINPEAIN